MADLQELEAFVSQIAKPERTITCYPDGISFDQFTTVCDLPGALDITKGAIQASVLQVRQVTLNQDEKIANIAIIVQLLIDKLASFVTLEQYAWLVRTTIAAQLLKELPANVASLVSKLSIAVEGIELADFNHSPSVVHVVAKSLIENIPLTGGNLLHAIKRLAMANCPLLYYTAVALVFAGLDAIIQLDGKPPELYCVQGMNEFLRRLEIFNLQYLQQQSNNLQSIYQLLKLFSLYQNMVIMRHAGKSIEVLSEEHKSYAELLHVTNAQIRTFRKWLDNASAIVQPFGKDQEKDYLILADLLQVDMIPLFDDLSQDEDIV